MANTRKKSETQREKKRASDLKYRRRVRAEATDEMKAAWNARYKTTFAFCRILNNRQYLFLILKKKFFFGNTDKGSSIGNVKRKQQLMRNEQLLLKG